MNVLFLPREGVELFRTLHLSETSRDALRFYRPHERYGGVVVTMSSLGSALSLASDLRWYVKRYMREVLFEIMDGIFCTHELAREIYYDRSVLPEEPWNYRRLYVIEDNRLVSTDKVTNTGSDIKHAGQESKISIEVWCTEHEYSLD
ncbi:MAG TPA: DUF5804 family protein [Methanoregulaceae archaeon]|nr:DUF5804 family protein [Methanoregulaceae archaeon]